MDDKTKECLMSDDLINYDVELGGKKYTLISVAGSGFKGVLWKCKDAWGNHVAIKFAAPEDYEERSFLQEATFASKLRGYPLFAQFIDVELKELPLGESRKRFVCFVEEWIEGPSLDEYLESTQNISSSFLAEFVRMMCEALNNLSFYGLCHDDLRPSNIKIAPPKAGSIASYETEVKIVDTGSLKRAPSKKEMNDHRWFVRHIIDIRNTIYRRKKLSNVEKNFLEAIRPLLDRMFDEDQSTALMDPSKIASEFETTWRECHRPVEEREQRLEDPFHYISAETISSDKLLVDLFAESCPWKSDVLSPDQIVLTGPRGCGKSTIFRRMSLKGMFCKGEEEIKNSNIAGFYISCTTDLRNHLNWIQSENLIRRFRGEVLHYFNLLMTREIVSTLKIIATRSDREAVFGFGPDEEKRLYRFIVNKIMVPSSERLRLQGVSPMAHCFELLENEMEKCHDAMIGRLSLPQRTLLSYISDLTSFLTENINYFRQRKIVFFIDDLSTRQIPKEVQSILNDVILARAKTHTFKLSSDKYGWTGWDSLDTTGEKTREFVEVDCGKFYLVDADTKMQRKFTTELLAKRLKLAGYEGTPEEVIGHSKYVYGSLGKDIRNRASRKEVLNDVYCGLETITDLCCGDISVLLEIYRRIFKKGGVEINTHATVPSFKQHEVIVSVSRELYDHIKRYRPHGEEMFAIATCFGTLCSRILREGKLIRQKDKTVIPETTRIEVDEDPTQPQIGLTDRQRNMMVELVKRAIFIEMDPGRARRDFTPSLRWQLRPILCPTFLTTPSKTFAIKWTPEQFRFFLSAPEDSCNLQLKKLKEADTPKPIYKTLDSCGTEKQGTEA